MNCGLQAFEECKTQVNSTYCYMQKTDICEHQETISNLKSVGALIGGVVIFFILLFIIINKISE